MKFISGYHQIVGIVLFSCSSIFAQQKIKIDGVAAVVGDKIILDSDIVKFKQEIESRAEGREVDISDCEIIENVMTQKLLAHQAVIDSVIVSDAEVDSGVSKTLQHFKSQVGDMDKVVELYGFDDLEDLTSELTRIEKENMLIQRERQSAVENVVVTPEEVRFFYNDLKTKGDLPNFGIEVELAQISIKAIPTEESVKEVIDKLNAIKKDVENGYSMRLKAILYSEDPSVAQNGGQFSITRQSGFVKEFKEAAFSIEEGEVSEPFKTQFGYHILKVEKIKGQERDVRHVLIQPKVEELRLNSAKEKLESIKAQIIAGEITFEEAVIKYSDDLETRQNKGRLMNRETGDSKFELNKMDAKMFSTVDKLKEAELTEVFFEETREGEKSYKLMTVRQRVDAHEADMSKDYAKIQQLALEKKRNETLEKWFETRIKDTYVKINGEHKECEYKYNWLN